MYTDTIAKLLTCVDSKLFIVFLVIRGMLKKREFCRSQHKKLVLNVDSSNLMTR